MRAVALLSGGLDSILACKVMLEQGIQLEALNYVTPFCTCTPKSNSCSAAASAVRQLDIPLKVINTSKEFLEVVKNPKHGYGSNMNPCIDCRILMFGKGREHMNEIGASFIVTGEVLGERPMSQRREVMKLIEKESGLEGLIVRPLSAVHLKPSIPEEKGWVDRTKLLGISGRSRKPQIALAKDYGLKDYPCPAGGCLLTDPGFARRMKDLIEHDPDLSLNDVHLLKLGRHFRLSPTAKAVVGRDEEENKKLIALRKEDDVLLEDADLPGPLTLVRGSVGDEELSISAAITARYGKSRDLDHVRVSVTDKEGSQQMELSVRSADERTLDDLRVGAAAPSCR